ARRQTRAAIFEQSPTSSTAASTKAGISDGRKRKRIAQALIVSDRAGKSGRSPNVMGAAPSELEIEERHGLMPHHDRDRVEEERRRPHRRPPFGRPVARQEIGLEGGPQHD